MMDFIFNVDLTTIYVITRRDFATAHDEIGVTSSPLGAGFYWSAEAASQAARQYCLREAAKGLSFLSNSASHGQKDGMYWGGCITREPERDRFEIRVRKLKARGGPSNGGGGGTTNTTTATRCMTSNGHRRDSNTLRGGNSSSRDRLVSVQDHRPFYGDGEKGHRPHHQHHQQRDDGPWSRCSESVSLRLSGSRAGRLWDSLRKR